MVVGRGLALSVVEGDLHGGEEGREKRLGVYKGNA